MTGRLGRLVAELVIVVASSLLTLAVAASGAPAAPGAASPGRVRDPASQRAPWDRLCTRDPPSRRPPGSLTSVPAPADPNVPRPTDVTGDPALDPPATRTGPNFPRPIPRRPSSIPSAPPTKTPEKVLAREGPREGTREGGSTHSRSHDAHRDPYPRRSVIDMERLTYTVSEVAELLGISRSKA